MNLVLIKLMPLNEIYIQKLSKYVLGSISNNSIHECFYHSLIKYPAKALPLPY